MKTIETILDEFDKKFNRLWLHDGNLPVETYISCEEDVKSFLRQALTQQLDELKGKIEGISKPKIGVKGQDSGIADFVAQTVFDGTKKQILTLIDSMK